MTFANRKTEFMGVFTTGANEAMNKKQAAHTLVVVQLELVLAIHVPLNCGSMRETRK